MGRHPDVIRFMKLLNFRNNKDVTCGAHTDLSILQRQLVHLFQGFSASWYPSVSVQTELSRLSAPKQVIFNSDRLREAFLSSWLIGFAQIFVFVAFPR